MMKPPDAGTDLREVWSVEPNVDLVAEAIWRLAPSTRWMVAIRSSTWPLALMAADAGAGVVGVVALT